MLASAAVFWVNSDNNSVGAANLGKTHETGVNQRFVAVLGPVAEGIATGAGVGLGQQPDQPRPPLLRQARQAPRQGAAQLHHGCRRPGRSGGVWRRHLLGTAGSIGRALLNGTDVNENFVPNESATGGNDLNYATGIARASTATGTGVQQFITNLDFDGFSSVPRGVVADRPLRHRRLESMRRAVDGFLLKKPPRRRHH